jgi:hypothetical protein
MKKQNELTIPKIWKMSVAIVAVSLFCACSNDNLDNPQDKSETLSVEKKTNGVKTTLAELGYNSVEEMYANGWVKIVPDNLNANTTSNQGMLGSKMLLSPSTKAAVSTIKEKLTAGQVRQLGLGDFDLRKLFIKSGVVPDGISINDGGIGSYVNTSSQYGWYAYVETGTPIVKSTYTDTPGDYTYTSFIVTNQSDQVDSAKRDYTVTIGSVTKWQVTTTAGVKIGGEIGIPLVAKGTFEASLEVAAGGGEEKSKLTTSTYTYTMAIPPMSKRTVVFKQRNTTSRVEYTIPIKLSGSVGANYPVPVGDVGANRHYFWSYPASKLTKKTINPQMGSITINEALEVEAIAGPAVKL